MLQVCVWRARLPSTTHCVPTWSLKLRGARMTDRHPVRETMQADNAVVAAVIYDRRRCPLNVALSCL